MTTIAETSGSVKTLQRRADNARRDAADMVARTQSNDAQATSKRRTVIRPVGQIEVLSTHLDPANDLGMYSPAPVRNYQRAQDAPFPPFKGEDAGHLYDYCERFGIDLVRPQLIGKLAGARRWTGIYRYTLEAKVQQ